MPKNCLCWFSNHWHQYCVLLSHCFYVFVSSSSWILFCLYAILLMIHSEHPTTSLDSSKQWSYLIQIFWGVVCSVCLSNGCDFSGSGRGKVVDYCNRELLGEYPVETWTSSRKIGFECADYSKRAFKANLLVGLLSHFT